MLPGPTIIISCPFCGQYSKKETIISGNTYGAQLWSDGKRIAPMMPENPILVVCKKCDQFFWVKDAKMVTEVTNAVELKEKWGDVDYVEFPTFHQYFKALELIPDEIFIRGCIWRSYNDYFRNNEEDKITSEMEQLNSENLTALLKILDENDTNELLTKAEVHRNLGQFEKSKELLDRINDPELTWVKEKFLQEINNQNKRVTLLR